MKSKTRVLPGLSEENENQIRKRQCRAENAKWIVDGR